MTSRGLPVNFVFRSQDDNDDSDDETDEDMPPLETSATDTATPRSDDGTSSPTYRIAGPIRRRNKETGALEWHVNGSVTQDLPDNITANNPTTSNNDTTTADDNDATTTSGPLAMNWGLFPTTGEQQLRTVTPFTFGHRSTTPFTFGSTTAVNHTNNTPFTFGGTPASASNSNSEEDRRNPNNHNPFAALQSESSDEDDIFSEVDSDADEDEVLSYHSSEFESEEEDDDNDNTSPEMPRGMLNFFHMMTNQVLDSDNDDDDDDPSDCPCTCPHCLMERFGCQADESDDDDASETPLDDTASPCAICLDYETRTRPFVHLPCCGIGTAESTSSTRFCQKCLVRYLAKNGCGVPAQDPTKDEGLLAGECPRCKHLLVLEENDDSDETPYYRRTKPVKATTRSLYWYIGRKDGGNYRVYLLTLGWMAAGYIPEELLLNDAASGKRIEHLCQWGLLQKRKLVKPWGITTRLHQWIRSKLPNDMTQLPNAHGYVYFMDPSMQLELRTLLLQHLEIDVDDDLQLRLKSSSPSEAVGEENGRRQCFMQACNCAASAWMALCQFRVIRALRIANRGLTLGLLSSKCLLPPVAEWSTTKTWGWQALTGLNWFLVLAALKVLRQVLWIAVYLAQAFLICQLIGSCLVTPKKAWKRWIAVAYGLCRLGWWCWCLRDRATAEGDTTSIIGVQEEL